MKYLVLLFVGFSSFIVEVNAQDTVCYKETLRFTPKEKIFLAINAVTSYKYPWLFYVEGENDTSEDSITLTIQSQYSTLSKKIIKIYKSQRLGTTKEGYPFLLFYTSNSGKGNCKILLFDSLLNVTRSFYVIKTELPYAHHPYTYEDITYLSVRGDSIILKSSMNYHIAYYFSLKDKIVKELRVRGAVYDLSLNRLIKPEIPESSIKGFIIESHEGYIYDLSRRVIYGKISNELLNRKTIFIKGGFATQANGNADIIFFQFCD